MAAKLFEVGDVLPATTQLRISWINHERLRDDITHYITTNFNFIAFQDDDPYFRSFRIRSPSTSLYYITSYNSFIANDCIYIVDTSLWTEQERTVTVVEEELSMYTWEDLNAPSGFSITYEENGGSSVTDLTEQTNLPNPLPTPTKSGYTFNGWFYESNFTTQAQASDTLSANVTLYAKWTLNSYTITYNSNGGSSVSQVSGLAFLPSTLPTTTKANHVFAGWYYDNLFTQKANAGDELTANVTLYAKWYTPTSWCEDIADAIREKEGSSEPIKHVDFADRIRAL